MMEKRMPLLLNDQKLVGDYRGREETFPYRQGQSDGHLNCSPWSSGCSKLPMQKLMYTQIEDGEVMKVQPNTINGLKGDRTQQGFTKTIWLEPKIF